jgi:hypothetical protein
MKAAFDLKYLKIENNSRAACSKKAPENYTGAFIILN